MLTYLIGIFSLFTLLSIPAIGIFSANNGLEGLNNYSKAKFSLGNLGFSDSNCLNTYIGMTESPNMKCKVGTFGDSFLFGIIPFDIEGKTDFCGDPTNENVKQGVKDCSPIIDSTRLN
jgi:hypothetical protein